jgi:hypothetical protein
MSFRPQYNKRHVTGGAWAKRSQFEQRVGCRRRPTGGRADIRMRADFRKIVPAEFRARMEGGGGTAAFYSGTQPKETAASHPVKPGFVGIPWRNSSDASLIQELSTQMLVPHRQPKSETDLAALCRRRECVVSVIRAMECYQHALDRPPQGRSRRAPRPAASRWNRAQ